MLLNIVLLAIGCVLLYFGAEWLVRGSAAIATSLGIPKSVVGLTLVAFGTSAPEMFVNVIAGLQGETGFALSNVSGSNLTNICVGFGICGLTSGIVVSWSAFRSDCAALIISVAIVTGVLFLDPSAPRVPAWTCILLLLFLAYYLLTLRRRAGTGLDATLDDIEEITGETPSPSVALNAVLFLVGVVALYGGGECVLRSAVAIAKTLSIDASLIGLTIVAAGTSVPDTVASVIAARKQEHEIAVGNLVGSNISNVLVVLSGTIIASWASGAATASTSAATSAAAAPGVLVASGAIMLDYAMVCLVSIGFVAIVATTGRVAKPAGIAMLVAYTGYMGLRIFWEVST